MFTVSTNMRQRPIHSPLRKPTDQRVGSLLRFFSFAGLLFGARGQNLDLATLDGTNGFAITDMSGRRIGPELASAGDFNGDGITDLIIGHPEFSLQSPRLTNVGRAYVLFGGQDHGGGLELSNLNETRGLTLNGITDRLRFGSVVAGIGDINDDGIDDLSIGEELGKTYVLFGRKDLGLGSSFDLANLRGATGFTINNPDGRQRVISGRGDVNGDGVSDLLIGSTEKYTFNTMDTGKAYVVLGGKRVGSGGTLDLSRLNGANGCVYNGAQAGNQAGSSVAGVKDFNDDGIDDLIIGASRAGKVYIIFGNAGLCDQSSFDLSGLVRRAGFAISGAWGITGAGDLNADGITDLLIGASDPSPDPDRRNAGRLYAVFGRSTIGSGGDIALYSLDSTQSFVVNGQAGDQIGSPLSNLGDINGDGIDDFIIGAAGTGRSYVVYGGVSVAGRCGVIEPSKFDGTNGFVISGIQSGRAVADAGDFNQDGVRDLAIGAYGKVYVVFGRKSPSPSTSVPTTTTQSTRAQGLTDPATKSKSSPTSAQTLIAESLTGQVTSTSAMPATADKSTTEQDSTVSTLMDSIDSSATETSAATDPACLDIPSDSSGEELGFLPIPTAITAGISALVSAVTTAAIMCKCRRNEES